MPAAQRTTGLKVLVVDDDAIIRQAHSRLLSRFGYEVVLAASGNEALVLLKNLKVDVVLADVRMPDGSGMDLLSAIQTGIPSKPRVILATGYADISNERAMELGAQAIIQKPVSGKHLRSLLEIRNCRDPYPKPGWLKLIGPFFFCTPLEKEDACFLVERGKDWLDKFGYIEIKGHRPVSQNSILYGAELRDGGPHEAIVQVETEASLRNGDAKLRFEALFHWKMVRPEFRKIVIAVPASAAENPLLYFYDEVLSC